MIKRFTLTSVCLCHLITAAFAQIQNGGIYSDGPIWVQVLHNYDLGKQMELHVLDFGYGWNGGSNNNTTCYPNDGTTTGLRLFKGSTLIHDFNITCVGTHDYIDWPIPGTLTPGDDYRFHMYYDYRPNTTCCAAYYSTATPNFTIGKGPNLILPQNGSTYPVDLTFQWNSNAYDQSYQLAIFNDPNFSHSCTNGVSSGVPAIYEINILDTFYQVPENVLSPGTQYNYILTAKQFGLCFRNSGSFTTDSAVPIELIVFQAEAMTNSVFLEWNTAYEEDNSHFVVEHSLDGLQFNSLVHINSQGDSDIGNFYRFKHTNPSTGTNYYRLIQHDYNGESSKSSIISINLMESQNQLKIVNSIVTDFLRLEGSVKNSMSFQIFDLNGNLIIKESKLISNELNLSTLQDGIYFIKVYDNIHFKTFRFMKF